MKTIKRIIKNPLWLIVFVLCFFSCELAEEIADYEPNYALLSDNAIVDESSAEIALNGIYGGFTNSAANSRFVIPSAFYGAGIETNRVAYGWGLNKPSQDDTSYGPAAYSNAYFIIANINWLLKEIDKLSDTDFTDPNRRTQIIAEARAMRATLLQYNLLLFGEWYDTASSYGIPIKTQENSEEIVARSTVAEVYTQIEADLDYAIANTRVTSDKTYINQVYAKALKARIKLLQADYPAAATLAKDVIDNAGGNYDVTTPYNEIFDTSSSALYNTNEQIFVTSSAVNGDYGPRMSSVSLIYVGYNPEFGNFAETKTITVGGQVINIDDNMNRVKTLTTNGWFGHVNLKYHNPYGPGSFYDAIYHMRMAEVYLIYAEAEARVNNSVTTDALNALNAVRIRAGATTTGGDGFETYPETISYDQFLEAVRLEKVIELWQETGQEWFDLVRYAYHDGGFESGFKVSDVKAEATNPNFFILPIPRSAVNATDNVVVQNPGYN